MLWVMGLIGEYMSVRVGAGVCKLIKSPVHTVFTFCREMNVRECTGRIGKLVSTGGSLKYVCCSVMWGVLVKVFVLSIFQFPFFLSPFQPSSSLLLFSLALSPDFSSSSLSLTESSQVLHVKFSVYRIPPPFSPRAAPSRHLALPLPSLKFP